MAHFAKVINKTVVDIIVAEPEFIEEFQDRIQGEWIQTSYNTSGGIHYDPETREPSADQSKALRYNFATVGGGYDPEADAFYKSQPYPSWVLNPNTFLWEAPVERPEPTEGELNMWDEENQSWYKIPIDEYNGI